MVSRLRFAIVGEDRRAACLRTAPCPGVATGRYLLRTDVAVLAPWDIRSQHPSFSTNGCPKEPAQVLKREIVDRNYFS